MALHVFPNPPPHEFHQIPPTFLQNLPPPTNICRSDPDFQQSESMATGAAGDGFLRGGCLSGADMGIQRRPYHKNCRCALHQSGGRCPHRSRHNKVAYPIRRSWSEGSLVLLGQASPSPSSSPAAEIPRTNSQSVMCEEEDSPKI